MRHAIPLTVFVHLCATSLAHAQPPATGPLLLRMPATPRTAALGNAWVAGRDQEVLFYNPAQLIGARTGLDLSLIRFGHGTTTTLGGVYTGGKLSLTLGWGAQIAAFDVSPDTPYPYSPDVLVTGGEMKELGALFAVGGAIVYKGFRIGAAGKWGSDGGQTGVRPPSDPGLTPTSPAGVFLADVGVARNIFGGVAAFSAQNLGRRSIFGGDDDEDDDDDSDDDEEDDDVPPTIPRQMLMGWSIARPAGALDLALYTQVLVRSGWTGAGAGLDVGYSWIEGCSLALRAGARRPESGAERPYAFGGALTIDRVSVEYSIQFFDEGRHAHGVTLRWR